MNLFRTKTTVMDKARDSRIIRTMFAIIFAITLAIPTAALTLPTQSAYAANAPSFTSWEQGRNLIQATGAHGMIGSGMQHATTSGEVAYCYEQGAAEPYANIGYQYGYVANSRAAAILDHGYPNTTNIGGQSLSADQARQATQVAIWCVSGAGYQVDIDNAHALRDGDGPVAGAEEAVAAAKWLVNTASWMGSSNIYYVYTETGNDGYQEMLSTTPQGGYLQIHKSSANSDITNGNACYSLQGAQYGIYSSYANAENDSNRLATLTTGSDGVTGWSGLLQFGTYYYKELSAPNGYALDTGIYSIAVNSNSTDGNNVAHAYTKDQPQNDPAGILLGKFDGEYTYNGEANLPQGAASLEGAEFTVQYYDGFYDTAEDAQASGDPTRTWVFATNKNGYVDLSNEFLVSGDSLYTSSSGLVTLPLGTLIIQETKAPNGYLLNNEIFVRQISSEGSAETVKTYNMPEVSDQVKRGDLEFTKANENNQERIANIPFLMTSVSTGEAHVIVTDENGYYSSATAFNPHSNNTNGNDAALTNTGTAENPVYEIDDSLLDAAAGLYFGMNADGEAVPQVTDDYGALPYDTYTIQELPCTANEGLQLLNTQVTISRDNYVIDLGTLDDPKAYISTVAKDSVDGDKYVVSDPESEIIDTVSYTGLVENRTYVLETTIVDLTDNNNVVANGTTEFVAKKANGTVDIPVSFDTTPYPGHEFAVIEVLTCDDKEIASHNEDLTDDEQMFEVIPSSIDTTATDRVDGDKNVVIDAETTIIDQIDTTSFIPGVTYTAYGELMHRIVAEDGSVTVEPFTVNGEAVTNTIEFTATAASESVEMEFHFDATEYAGQTVDLVVYETIFRNVSGPRSNYIVVEEKDSENVKQQAKLVPSSIGTQAFDGFDGDKMVVADPESKFVDTVSYDNLIVSDGLGYTLSGIIMDRNTHLPVLFGLDAESVTEEQVQAFWDDLCTALGIEFSTGEEPSDGTEAEDNTEEPSDGTEAGDNTEDSSKSPTAVVPTGSIDFEAVQQVIDNPDHEAVVSCLAYASMEVTPEKASGSVDMTFDTVDTTQLAGTNTVVFELLTKGDRIVTSHLDYDSMEQQVDIVNSEIGTQATDKSDGNHELLAGRDATIIDTVSYTNLIPGKEYTISGVLMDKATGKPLMVDDSQVTAEASFTPNHADGTIELEFTFDASALEGTNVVVFETLYKDGIEVAVHQDINDENQTVSIVAGPEGTSFDKTGETILPIIIGIVILLAAAGALTAYAFHRRRALASADTSSLESSESSDPEK